MISEYNKFRTELISPKNGFKKIVTYNDYIDTKKLQYAKDHRQR